MGLSSDLSASEAFDSDPQRLKILAETLLPTRHGPLRCLVFSVLEEPLREHVAMLAGDVRGENVLLCLHSECITSEVFGSLRCRCREQLKGALERLTAEGRGLLVYRRRGLEQANAGHDYDVTASLLRELEVNSVRLLSDRASEQHALEAQGVAVRARVPRGALAHSEATRAL